ncbi:hypothetical protein RHMOL_Rhmol02G0166500 [Rhododendron molle]|uniref:Uncharacterized protein n=1 Tax=Rhododendron molle TaxID=49168 RepID=A0ACC0PU04_RHOML|nr:hypothetical protein RHMOL_Rhmol02G0166500 [Rhododendron molle]
MEVVFDHSAGDALCSETMCLAASPMLFRSPMPVLLTRPSSQPFVKKQIHSKSQHKKLSSFLRIISVYMFFLAVEREVMEAMSGLWRSTSGFPIILPNIIIAIDAPRGFLFEWFVFWDVFIARTNEKHSEAASAYIETQQMKAPEHQQQLQMQQLQLIQHQLAQRNSGSMSAALQQMQGRPQMTTDIKQEVNMGASQKFMPMDPSSVYGQAILRSKSGLGGAEDDGVAQAEVVVDCPLDGEGGLVGEVNNDLAVGVSRGVGGRKLGEEHLTFMEASGGRSGSMAYALRFEGGIVSVTDHGPYPPHLRRQSSQLSAAIDVDMEEGKLQSEALREAFSQIPNNAREKKCKFTETIEPQIGLKDYAPQKDKHFSGSVKLSHIPRPKMKVCMLGDAQHVEEAEKIGLEYMDVEGLKKLSKNKKLAKKFHAFLASEAVIKQIPRLLGLGLNKAGNTGLIDIARASFWRIRLENSAFSVIMDLEICAGTLVGDETRTGISGGQLSGSRQCGFVAEIMAFDLVL